MNDLQLILKVNIYGAREKPSEGFKFSSFFTEASKTDTSSTAYKCTHTHTHSHTNGLINHGF